MASDTLTIGKLTRARRAGRLFGTAAALVMLAIAAADLPAHAVTPADAPGGTSAAVTPPTPADSGKSAAAPATVPPSQRFACGGPVEFTHLYYPLRQVARRLGAGLPVTIVAVGSSSTAGAGATSPAANYPSRLAVELKQLLPGRDITVLNRGVNGDETRDMLARFESGVIAARPDLVLWQVGTNSVLRDVPLTPHSVLLHEGIDRLKAAGADVVLIDMQFAPPVLVKPETQGMEHQIALTAKEESVDLFRRFALMRDWHDVQHIPFDAFISGDGLHMNDWGYACVAKLLAAGIVEAATRPVAAAHSGR
jgi:acyl-CoA thioesterase-1